MLILKQVVPILTRGLSTVKDGYRTYTYTDTYAHILKFIYMLAYKAGNVK